MISVIIPVYNTEVYLPRCIDSILKSSYEKFELILVNDGSDDNSPEICRKYSQSDSRIRFIDQKHMGVSAARNRGIKESHGEWIVFVDSDDFIAHDFFEMIVQDENQYYDLLIFDYMLLKEKGRKKGNTNIDICDMCIHAYEEKDKIYLVEKLLYSRQLVKNGNTSLVSPWAKAYKKSVIDQYSIQFPSEIVIGEDRLFNLEYIMSLKSAMYIEKVACFIEIRKDSAMHKFNHNYLYHDLQYQKRLKDMLYQRKIFPSVEKAYYNLVLFGIADVLIKGVFHPDSTRTCYENYKLCYMMQKNKIYERAMSYHQKIGSIPRRVLLFFYHIKCYRIVSLMSRISYRILEYMEML